LVALFLCCRHQFGETVVEKKSHRSSLLAREQENNTKTIHNTKTIDLLLQENPQLIKNIFGIQLEMYNPVLKCFESTFENAQ
jgi:hypothetical protein